MYSDRDFIDLNKSLKEYDRMIIRTRIFTIFTETVLRYTSLKTTEKLLSIFFKNVPSPDYNETIIIIDRYTTIFNKMNQQAYLKGRCLSQSLVMRLLLNREGISSELKIGVRQDDGKFDAHAWLEKEGTLLNDHPSVIADYLVLQRGKLNSTLKFK